jgi:hypothetical protein
MAITRGANITGAEGLPARQRRKKLMAPVYPAGKKSNINVTFVVAFYFSNYNVANTRL